ncbi:hypothetical protein CYY_004294 [Polysphondylium violaceum]|uniref:PNPLA domain-containing protein n=1 Tax=Polysphondylium violaceum TaxID=133409 RepID=A0A8J4V0F5_9MYCE|nr:hypothetical protein CYY_004294 [Polysphondylium violaceum]
MEDQDHTIQEGDIELSEADIEEYLQNFSVLPEHYDSFVRDNSFSLLKSRNQSGEDGLKKKKKFGLSLSGGGVRGYIEVLILLRLQDKMKKDEVLEDKSVLDLFDFVAGTSIGGINALALAHNISLDQLVTLFKERAKKIFPSGLTLNKIKNIGMIRGGKFAVGKLEKQLTEFFGTTALKDLKKPILVTACSSDHRPIIFSNEDPAHKDYLVADIGRCTSAAPTYFNPKSLSDGNSYVDGGLFANNPSALLAGMMAKKFKVSSEDIVILSLGTGNNPDLPARVIKNMGATKITTILDMIMDSTFKAVSQTMNMFLGEQYIDINPPLKQIIDLADSSKMDEMEKVVNEHSGRIDQLLDEFLELYKNEQE